MGVITSLTTADLTVEAGARAVATIRVRNTGSIVDRFDIDVVGVTASWATVDPASLSLFPGAEGTATITFAPARASLPRAGTVPFGVRIRPAADPAGSTVEEGRVTVLPFSSASADIAPQTSRGPRGARHEVLVDNRGNAPVEVVVTATDPDRRLGLTVVPERAIVGPDQRVAFRVDVRVDDPFPFGPSRPRPFVVTVEPGRQEPIQLRASLNQRALLPGWLPRVGAVAGLALVLGVGAFVLGAGPFAAPPKPTPAPTAAATPAPTPSPSIAAVESPSAGPAQSQGPSAPPSPTAPLARIQFRDFELEDTGNTRDGVTKSRMNPTFRFATDGPGDVTFLLDRIDGDNGQGLRLCLGAAGKKATCKTLKAPGPLVVPNAEAGPVEWTASITTPADNIAPFAGVAFEFYALRPSLTWSDNADFFCDPSGLSPGYCTFTALVTAREAKLFGVDIQFKDRAATFGVAARDAAAPQQPLALTGPVFSYQLPVLPMAPPNLYEFRFSGTSTSDSGPVDYSATFSW